MNHSPNSKIRVAFFIPATGIESVDLSHPTDGNPGIGGTEFCQILLATELANYSGTISYEVIVYSLQLLQLQKSITNNLVEGIDNLPKLSDNFDILIIRVPGNKHAFEVLSNIDKPIICWSHNYVYGQTLKMLCSTDNIKCNVFVSKQMYDRYIDDDIINKSCYIFNMVPDAVGEKCRNISDHVVFVGSISESKGIIELLKIWQQVERTHPQAVIDIIGGGNLYSRNYVCGDLGITDQRLEEKMKPYILDADGMIKSNIRFHGILGNEKYNLFLNSSVGIVNPSARTETFGLGIIEMATCSLPVVTKNWNGFPDTAKNEQTALLSFSIKSMANNICRLLDDIELNKKYGFAAKKHSQLFSPEKIIETWNELILSVVNNQFNAPRLPASAPYLNNFKFIRYINSKLRFSLRLKFFPSVISLEAKVAKFLKMIRP